MSNLFLLSILALTPFLLGQTHPSHNNKEECKIEVVPKSLDGPLPQTTIELAKDMQLVFDRWIKPFIKKPPLGTWRLEVMVQDPDTKQNITVHFVPPKFCLKAPEDYSHNQEHRHPTLRNLSFEIVTKAKAQMVESMGYNYKHFTIEYPQSFPFKENGLN